MTNYLLSFSIYTLAMVGVIFGALFLFKFVMGERKFSKKSEFLNIEETMSLSPRKTLYVVKAGDEKFLIASDLDKTNLISKLEFTNPINQTRQNKNSDKNLDFTNLEGLKSLDEFSSVIDFEAQSRKKRPMMKGLAEKLQTL